MNINKTLLRLICIAAFLIQGCTGIGFYDQTQTNSRDATAIFFFTELDRLTQEHSVQDSSKFPVDGFPYLRADRFLEALKSRLNGVGQERYWVEWMQQLDLKSRKKEIANLPETAVLTLAGYAGTEANPDAVYQQAAIYSQRLLAEDHHDPRFVEKIKNAIFVPDEYSTFRRWIGIYPLAGIPVTIATSLSYGRYRKWHESDPGELRVQGKLERFGPPEVNSNTLGKGIERLFHPENLNTLGLPKLSHNHVQMLARQFAPVIIQDISAPYDRFGKIRWRKNRVVIDSSEPAVYFYISYSFLSGRSALQLNYTVWYAERAGEGTPWIEKGPLDGLTYRVTLNEMGAPVMMDIMNNCGCYYFFVPKKERIRKIVKKPGELEPLIPAWMPEGFPIKRAQLRVNSGWHQVQNITTDDIPSAHTEYELIPYDTLESLPKENGRHESVFTAEGVMKDSWRIEPYLFFSMGISNVGYMRQRGHHAIKLVGREHFTNPYLFDKNFMFISN